MGFGFRSGDETGNKAGQKVRLDSPKNAAKTARRGGNAIVGTSRKSGNWFSGSGKSR